MLNLKMVIAIGFFGSLVSQLMRAYPIFEPFLGVRFVTLQKELNLHLR